MGILASGRSGERGVLFLVDPLQELKAHKDSSVAMMRELARRGYALWACTPRDLTWESGSVRAAAQPITLDSAAGAPHWYVAQPRAMRRLVDFAAVLMRKDPPFDAEYLYATHLLGDAARGGAHVFNAPEALRDHNEKLAITEFAQFIAPTLVSCDSREILDFHDAYGEIVIKPLDGMGGSGVFRISAGDPNTTSSSRPRRSRARAP